MQNILLSIYIFRDKLIKRYSIGLLQFQTKHIKRMNKYITKIIVTFLTIVLSLYYLRNYLLFYYKQRKI